MNQALRAHTPLPARRRLRGEGRARSSSSTSSPGASCPAGAGRDGLHQAVEAKEKVKIERENQTLATITFQNYFRMYEKLAGMTGTAETEAAEFDKIYKLEVVVIPTNRPMIRVENPDVVYRTERREVRRGRGGDRATARDGPAGAGRHDLDREVRDALDRC